MESKFVEGWRKPRVSPRPKVYGPLPKARDVDWAAPAGTPIPRKGGKVVKTK